MFIACVYIMNRRGTPRHPHIKLLFPFGCSYIIVPLGGTVDENGSERLKFDTVKTCHTRKIVKGMMLIESER